MDIRLLPRLKPFLNRNIVSCSVHIIISGQVQSFAKCFEISHRLCAERYLVVCKGIGLCLQRFCSNRSRINTRRAVTNLDALGEALNLATYNYMNGTGYDIPVKKWFKARK